MQRYPKACKVVKNEDFCPDHIIFLHYKLRSLKDRPTTTSIQMF